MPVGRKWLIWKDYAALSFVLLTFLVNVFQSYILWKTFWPPVRKYITAQQSFNILLIFIVYSYDTTCIILPDFLFPHFLIVSLCDSQGESETLECVKCSCRYHGGELDASRKEFETVNWLNIKERYNHCVNSIAFKYFDHLCHHYLNEVFIKPSECSLSLRNS